ncbi:hypothetical protein DM47_3530 [Burkholderia mallei]|nr:hypothetical protein DM47_3530 [Burkholderia mallei]KOT22870.1 hypothetical protein DM52_2667 [Burkholderia mallei]
MKAVRGHRVTRERHVDPQELAGGPSGGPARQRGIQARRAQPEIPPERLRQRREPMHRRHRGQDHVRRAEASRQPFDERCLRVEPARGRHAVRHVVDAERGDDRVEACVGLGIEPVEQIPRRRAGARE